jgi:polyphosphate kinase 2 (PPK2 family)
VLLDRSWYNRAGVEHVMGFCTKEEYGRFLHQCPIFERLLVEDGIMLRKYWFSVSDAELPAQAEVPWLRAAPRELQSYVPDHAASL